MASEKYSRSLAEITYGFVEKTCKRETYAAKRNKTPEGFDSSALSSACGWAERTEKLIKWVSKIIFYFAD